MCYSTTASSSNKVHKPTKSGTTHKIREQLNFSDDKKWKLFSSRRLELIDKFGLSERKASEQDDNIRQIATILRTEFGYSVSSSAEFEKLVTAAVQSVRRNRKRSTKCRSKRPNGSASGQTSGGATSTNNTSDEDAVISRTSSPVQTANTSSTTPVSMTLPVLQPKPVRVIARQVPHELVPQQLKHEYQSVPTHVPVISSQQKYDELLKSIIADLVHNRVPLQEQSTHDDSSPNLTDFALSFNNHHLLSLALSSKKEPSSMPSSSASTTDEKIPFFLREKILLHVQRSKTCLELGSLQGSLDLYNNLTMLGETSIKSSIAFVIERFFSNLPQTSMEYITSKISATEQLALMCIKLFGQGTRRNLSQLPQDSKLRLFYLIIGGIIKDFGFDPCVYPLSEIVHDIILRQYPLICKSNQHTAILSTLSMKPAMANEDVNRKVVLKFNDREQRFVFYLLSNGPPTIYEVLENSRNLFQIVSQTKNLGLFHHNSETGEKKLIKDDMELAKIFNQFTTKEIVIEIKEMDGEDFNGLNILSSVSTMDTARSHGFGPNYIHVSPKGADMHGSDSQQGKSSVAALDNIIGRISTPVGGQSSNNVSETRIPTPPPVKTQRKNVFENNNLPQPAFQPLL